MARPQNSTIKTTILLDGKQAEQAILSIEGRVDSLKKKKKELNDIGLFTGNSKEVADLEKELRMAERSLKTLRNSAKDVSEVISNMAGATEKQLGDAYRTLIKQTKNLDRTTQEYADNRKNIALLKDELDGINGVAKKQSMTLKEADDVLKRIGTASKNDVTLAMQALVEQTNRLDRGTQEYANNIPKIERLKEELDSINGVVKKQQMSFEEVEKVIGRIGTASRQELADARKVIEGRMSTSVRDGNYDLEADRQKLQLINQEIEKIDKGTQKQAMTMQEVNEILSRISIATREEVGEAIKVLEKNLAKADRRLEDVSEKETKLKRLRDEMDKMDGVVRKQEMSLSDVEHILQNIGTASVEQIKKAIKVQEDYNNTLDRTSREYAEGKAKAALLHGELEKINQTGAKQITMWDQMSKTMKRLASYVLAYFGFNKLMQGFRQMIDMNIKLSDQLSDIQKTTGLAGSALAELSNDINRIDTRTSVEQLNKLAYTAGKLGITAKEDVLGFVRAGNQINVALGEDLGEDAIKNIAKLNTVLGVTKTLGVEQGLLATGSAINELGQSSTAAEGYLVDFAKRMGGVASQSKLTIQQVLALGSATDQLGQNVETSATALNKFIITIVSKTEQVAKALKIPLNELKETLNRSTWEGILMVFQKMSERGGLASLAPIMGDLGSEGARLTAVLTALSANTGILNREIKISNQAFAEATSITNEANVKNENLAATIEKIGKNIQRWFLGSGIVDWILKVGQGVEEITRGLDTLSERFKKQIEIVDQLSVKMPGLLNEYNKLITSDDPENQEKLKNIIQDIIKLVPNAVTAFDEYGNAIAISTQRIEEFVNQSDAALRRIHGERVRENEDDLIRQERLLRALASKQEEITKKGYYTEIDSYGGNVLEIRNQAAIQKVTEEYQKQIRVVQELRQERELLEIDPVDRAGAERHKARIAAEIKQRQELEKLEKETNQKLSEETEKEAKKRIDAAMKAASGYIDQQKTLLIQARVEQSAFRGEMVDSETKYNEMLEKIEFEGLQKRLDILGLSKDKRAELERQFWDFKLRLFSNEEKEAQKFLNELDKLYDQFELKGATRDQRELIRIQQKYNDATKLIEDALKKQLISEEQYQEYINIIRKKGREAEEQYYTNKGGKDAQEELKRMAERQRQEELLIAEQRVQGLLTEAEYKKELLDIEMRYQEERFDVYGLTEGQITELKRKNADRQIQMLDQAARKQEQIQQQYADVVKTTASGIGESFGKLFEDSADVWKSFGDSMVDVAFDTMMKLVDIWLKEMQAKAIIDTAKGASQEIGSKGILGVITAAAIGGIIQGFLQVAKAGIKSLIGKGSSDAKGQTGQRVVKSSGFAVGGDTGPGGTYQPKGFVHSNEYVVPEMVMRDPVAFNHVRVIETIRRDKYGLRANPLRGYADGGGVDTEVLPVAQQADPAMRESIDELNGLLKDLRRTGLRAWLNYSNLKNQSQQIENSISRGSRPK